MSNAKSKARELILKYDGLFFQHRLSRSLKVRSLPHRIGMDVSAACNLRCSMCSLKDWYPTPESKLVPDEVIDRIVAYSSHLKFISLQCNCEPLLNPRIDSIIGTFKRANPAIVISLVTNGMLLTRARAEQLINSGLDEITVSIDGATKSSYEQVRQGADFDKVLENVRTFTDARSRAGSVRPRLAVIAVSSWDNLSELPSILELAISLGADHFHVNGLEAYTDEQRQKVLYAEKIDLRAERVFSQLHVLAKRNNISLTLPQLKLTSRDYCMRSFITVDCGGNVFPCPALSYERPYFRDGQKRVHPRILLGNLRESSIDQIISSRAFQSHQDAVLRGRLPEYCRGCLVKDLVIC